MNKEETRFEIIKALLARRADTSIEEVCSDAAKIEAAIFPSDDSQKSPQGNQHRG